MHFEARLAALGLRLAVPLVDGAECDHIPAYGQRLQTIKFSQYLTACFRDHTGGIGRLVSSEKTDRGRGLGHSQRGSV